MDARRNVNEAGSVEIPAVTNNSRSGGGLSRTLSVLLVIAAVIFISAYTIRAFNALRADAAVKGKQYQAVFLTNGQVYFGKFSRVGSQYAVLKDIYYLQVQQAVQPKDSSTSSNSSQVSLAKLGGELHGPEDVMFINSSQVLFWENLKTDGKVAKAIADYKAQGNK